MKLVKSELVLEEFFIVNSDYNFNEPKNDNANLKEFFNDYEIDIDFIVRDVKNEQDKYIIFAKVAINNKKDKVLPGYSLFAEAVSIYSFDPNSKLKEQQKTDFLWSSGVSISINCLRNYISSITAYYPLGKFMLPSVDLTSLLNTKMANLKKAKEIKIKKVNKTQAK